MSFDFIDSSGSRDGSGAGDDSETDGGGGGVDTESGVTPPSEDLLMQQPMGQRVDSPSLAFPSHSFTRHDHV
jgi:hypothetical protein